LKTLRNSCGPECGGAGGAQINLVTKAGGNQFHIDTYYFDRMMCSMPKTFASAK